MEPPKRCFDCTTHFLLHFLSKLRDLFRGRHNRGPAVQPGENATSDGLSQEEERRPPPASNSQVVSDATERGGGAQKAKTCSFIPEPEASIKGMTAKSKDDEIEYMQQPFSDSDDEDVCPTCLEEYHPENPKITAHCSHHFHLGCIFEWKERSDKCPVCFRVMEFEETT